MAPVTMYSTTWCGHCFRLKRQLDDAGIAYEEVDIDQHEQFADRIVEATGGYRTVPTLEVGPHLLVNPTVVEVQAALAASGRN
ncbi:MAG: NrdH-redoxin [Actinomycetota bacterium]|nr:NrdH-redoxin [Actinomycetota bacterium]